MWSLRGKPYLRRESTNFMASVDVRCALQGGQGMRTDAFVHLGWGTGLACYDFWVNWLKGFPVFKIAVLTAGFLIALGAPVPASAQTAAQADEIYRQGIAALQQGDLATAKADFEKVVAIQPRS